MNLRSLTPFLLSSSLLFACGGAVEPVGNSQGSSPSPAPTTTATGGSGSSSGGVVPLPQPAPGGPVSTWNKQASGCANVFVFDTDSTGKRFLIISGDKTTLGLAGLGDSYTADLGAADPIHVSVDTFQNVPQEPPYCTDIAYPNAETPVKSRAVQGKATITITSVGRDTDSYAVDVTLSGVVVKGPNGLETIPDMTFKSISVGWLPG